MKIGSAAIVSQPSQGLLLIAVLTSVSILRFGLLILPTSAAVLRWYDYIPGLGRLYTVGSSSLSYLMRTLWSLDGLIVDVDYHPTEVELLADDRALVEWWSLQRGGRPAPRELRMRA